ncbi:uncharacterized protein [Phaseolus vulgaris]|uniref:uncharacterized protein n=1 Tax=Phaseolus vulgaris TaxID=3885 RepID=UPI0035CA9ADF
MTVLFDYHELWDVVESGVTALVANAAEAQRVAHRDQKKKDNKALYLIHQGMNDETLEQIEGATTASEAWTILSTNYKGDDKIKMVRLQTLRRQYELLHMETTKTIDVYINKVLALTNQMKTNGETHSKQAKVENILRSLTPRFEHVVAVIEETNDISTMTVRSKGDNHVANCAQEDRNHVQDEEDHAVLMATTSNESPNNQTWYLDTGCTNHMYGQKELFADLDDSFRTKVKFGDGRFVPVTGKGRILITLKNGDHRIPFVKESWRAKFLLELVDTDVYGPMNISSGGEDGVTLEASTVQLEAAIQPEAVIQPEVAAPIATMMERLRRQQQQPVHRQDCEANHDDEVYDNGDLVHFVFLVYS